MSRLGQTQVEPGIVHEDQRIGVGGLEGGAGGAEIAEDLAQMAQHLAEGHKGHVTVVYHRRGLRVALPCRRGHLVAPEEDELCLRVGLSQCPHQRRCMYIARCLAGR